MSAWLTLLGPPLFIIAWIVWYCLQPEPIWSDDDPANEPISKEAVR